MRPIQVSRRNLSFFDFGRFLITKHQKRVVGPLLNRLEIQADVPRIGNETLVEID